MFKAWELHKMLMWLQKKSFISFAFDYTIYGDDSVFIPNKSREEKVLHPYTYRRKNSKDKNVLSYRNFRRLYNKGYPIDICLTGKHKMVECFIVLKEVV